MSYKATCGAAAFTSAAYRAALLALIFSVFVLASSPYIHEDFSQQPRGSMTNVIWDPVNGRLVLTPFGFEMSSKYSYGWYEGVTSIHLSFSLLVANPAWFEDFSKQPIGRLEAIASWDSANQYVLLTPAQSNLVGYYVLDKVKLWPAGKLSFRFKSWGGSGGEAIWLALFDGSTTATEDATDGGYHVVFDERESVVKVVRGTAVLASMQWTNDGNWHTVEVLYYLNGSRFYISVKIDGSQGISAVDSSPPANALSGAGLVYFGARTSGSTNNHAVDDILYEAGGLNVVVSSTKSQLVYVTLLEGAGDPGISIVFDTVGRRVAIVRNATLAEMPWTPGNTYVEVTYEGGRVAVKTTQGGTSKSISASLQSGPRRGYIYFGSYTPGFQYAIWAIDDVRMTALIQFGEFVEFVPPNATPMPAPTPPPPLQTVVRYLQIPTPAQTGEFVVKLYDLYLPTGLGVRSQFPIQLPQSFSVNLEVMELGGGTMLRIGDRPWPCGYVSFRFRAWGGSGADAIWLALFDNSPTPDEDSFGGGYHITFDEYEDRIRIRRDVVLAEYAITTLDNGNWHRAEVSYCLYNNVFYVEVRLNGTLILSVTDSSPPSNVLNNVGIIYIGARTAGANNNHAIDDLVVMYPGGGWKEDFSRPPAGRLAGLAQWDSAGQYLLLTPAQNGQAGYYILFDYAIHVRSDRMTAWINGVKHETTFAAQRLRWTRYTLQTSSSSIVLMRDGSTIATINAGWAAGSYQIYVGEGNGASGWHGHLSWLTIHSGAVTVTPPNVPSNGLIAFMEPSVFDGIKFVDMANRRNNFIYWASTFEDFSRPPLGGLWWSATWDSANRYVLLTPNEQNKAGHYGCGTSSAAGAGVYMRFNFRAWGGTGGEFTAVGLYDGHWTFYQVNLVERGGRVEIYKTVTQGSTSLLGTWSYSFGSGWHTAEVWAYHKDGRMYIHVAVNGTLVAEAVDVSPLPTVIYMRGTLWIRASTSTYTNFHAVDNIYVEPYHPDLHNTAPGVATAVDWRLTPGRRWTWRFSDVSRNSAFFRFVPQGSRVDGSIYLNTATGFNVSAPGAATYVEVPYAVPQLAGKLAGLMPTPYVFQHYQWERAYVSVVATPVPQAGVIDAMLYIPFNITLFDTAVFIAGDFGWNYPLAIAWGGFAWIRIGDIVGVRFGGPSYTVKVPIGRWFRFTVVYNETYFTVYVDGVRAHAAQKGALPPGYIWSKHGVGHMPVGINAPTLYYKYVAFYSGRVDMGEKLPDLGGLRYVYLLDATQSPPGFYTEAGAARYLFRYFVLPYFDQPGVYTLCGQRLPGTGGSAGVYVLPSLGDNCGISPVHVGNNIYRIPAVLPPGKYSCDRPLEVYNYTGVKVASCSEMYLTTTVFGYLQWSGTSSMPALMYVPFPVLNPFTLPAPLHSSIVYALPIVAFAAGAYLGRRMSESLAAASLSFIVASYLVGNMLLLGIAVAAFVVAVVFMIMED
ncbi:MAG: hypothetical protein ACK4SY_06720 [Pyrobaculum sp.]